MTYASTTSNSLFILSSLNGSAGPLRVSYQGILFNNNYSLILYVTTSSFESVLEQSFSSCFPLALVQSYLLHISTASASVTLPTQTAPKCLNVFAAQQDSQRRASKCLLLM